MRRTVSSARAMLAATGLDASHDADLSAQVIDGEQGSILTYGQLQPGMARPDELAVIVACMHDELLHVFCRLVQKALEVRHD